PHHVADLAELQPDLETLTAVATGQQFEGPLPRRARIAERRLAAERVAGCPVGGRRLFRLAGAIEVIGARALVVGLDPGEHPRGAGVERPAIRLGDAVVDAFAEEVVDELIAVRRRRHPALDGELIADRGQLERRALDELHPRAERGAVA